MDVTAMGKALSMSYDKALSGIAGMKGAEALAAEYMATGNDLEKQVDMLIRNQVIKCGASGFLTSLGGAITLPVALPANVLSVLYMQLQMIAAIAHMGGYDLQSDRVRTLVIACLCGNQLKEVLKQAGIKVNVSKFRKTNKRPSRICGGLFVCDLSRSFIPLGLSLRRCR